MTPLPPSEVRSTCPYCGVGCGVVIETQGGRITGVRGDTDHPANRGRLCTKGQSLHLTASPQVTLHRRLLHPMHRPRRGDTPQRLGWDAALELTAQGLARTVQRHGADAVGVYVSGQLLTEDYYLFNKFTKGLLGTNHIDSNSRLCMSSAVVGYKLTLGADAPPACYDDIQHADCLWVAGSNAAWAHPVLFRQVEDARRARPHMKMVVVDPRRTATAEMADLHLALQPGTDVLLCQGLLHIMRQQGWLNPHYIQQHTEGWDALQPSLDAATPEAVSALCGVAVPDLFTAAQWFAGSNATLSLYCQGLNQSVNGSANNAALIHLHLATGHMGRPGAGPFSLTGQPNAMGGREVGAMATLMSGHRTLSDAADREELAALWGVPSVPSAPGRTAMELFEAAADGQVKALWVACTNPAQSLPHQSMVKRALERAEFVVVQEAFAHAATLAHADVLLPAAPWGEKDGTVTNSERCISRVRAAVPPSGESRPDWRIVRDVAQRVAVALGRPEAAAGFAHTSPEAVWNEHRATTAGRDLDITGLSYGHLDNVGPAPWPFPRGAHAGRQRLYADGRFPTPSGRARFATLNWTPLAEERHNAYPFSLGTGRLRDQWHGTTRTGTAGRLFAHAPEPTVQLHPTDAADRGFTEGQWLRVFSKRGEVLLPLECSDAVGRLQAFIPMHWGTEVLTGRDAAGQPLHGVNAITTGRRCPQSQQPELKHAAAQVQALATGGAELWAMAWLPPEALWPVHEALSRALAPAKAAYLVPFSDPSAPLEAQDAPSGWMLRAVLDPGLPHTPTVSLWLNQVQEALGWRADALLRYDDPQRQQQRRLAVAPGATGQRHLQGALCWGDVRSRHWLREAVLNRQALPQPAHAWLQAHHQPPGSGPAPSRQVCSCLNVRQDRIEAELARTEGAPAQRLQQLQERLQCGTRCGSCVPELKRLLQALPGSAMMPTA